MQDNPMTPFQVLVSSFGVASLGGLAALLRANVKLTVRNVLAAILNSGLLGLTIALLWYKTGDDHNAYFVLGVSALAGVGGTTTLDFALQILRRYFESMPKLPPPPDSSGGDSQ